MSQHEDGNPLFAAIDDLADEQLHQLQRRVERARSVIDRAAQQLKKPGDELANIEPQGSVHDDVSAESELMSYLDKHDAPQVALPAPAPEPTRVLPKHVVAEPTDFGDIAATIATDDDWKKL